MHGKISISLFVFVLSVELVREVCGFTLKMGLLKVGVPKTWDDSKKNLGYIRNAGTRQFISTYNRVKDLKGDELLWGDEIEYGVFHIDPETKKVRLSLRAKEIMDALNDKEQGHSELTEGCTWVPEYGAWMVEATPNRPYTGYTTDLLRVERNMRLRRKRILTVLNENEIAPTVSAFPLIGSQGDDASVPAVPVGGPVTLSEYIGDGIINPHPRFGTLSANIRQRRGSKVSIRVPLFRDENTPEYKAYEGSFHGDDGCCGGDSQQLWRYGKGDASEEHYGRDSLVVGCSKSPRDEEADESGNMVMKKWIVDVKCDGCKGLFYRSAPNVIVPDADWPRNGETVVGYEIPDVPGWIRLQNGYYLPMYSADGGVSFLTKVSTRTNQSVNGAPERMGSSTPLFRQAEQEDKPSSLVMNGDVTIAPTNGSCAVKSREITLASPAKKGAETVRPAVHMDAMAFGMGCCCLQITFQATDVEESRFIYDQLAVMAPIMMALTASTPAMKGRLLDTDCRWGIISESVDCRTSAERGRADPNAPYDALNANGKRRIYKSRYDSISTYIYQGRASENGKSNRVLNAYNDIPLPIDEEKYHQLRKAEVDPALAQHVAHLFIRDPLVVFNGAVEEVNDEIQTEHFESIQSTNWQTVRWKPPPPRNSPNAPHIGWRTEFRSMEMQLTDFENAAFSVFTVLLQRVILTFDLNLYIPISKVDANMQRAHSRNAAAKGKFFFRRHMAPLEDGDDGYGVKYVSMFSRAANGDLDEEAIPAKAEDENGVSQQRRSAPIAGGSGEENSYEEMTMAEIMTGKGDHFPGLIPLVRAYLDHIHCDSVTLNRLSEYLDFIEKRACGELITPATWMRNFIRNHDDYKGDSVVTDTIAHDLLIACKDIGEGKLHVPELLGDIKIRPVTTEGAYDTKLDSKLVSNTTLLKLLQRYTERQSSFSPN